MTKAIAHQLPLAAAVIFALSSAMAEAADVRVYGKFDLGLSFTSVDSGSSGRVNTLKLLSGQTAGSRWGLKGSEDLGNGYKVGFVLESGFTTDDGVSAQGGRLFGRESIVQVTGPFGTLKLGRMGSLASGYPDTGLFGGNISPFAVSLGDVPGHRFIFTGDFGVVDNAITYVSPSFAGWKIHLQYSNGMDTKRFDNGTEGKSSVDRFYAAAVSFNNKTTEWNTAINSTNFASYGKESDPDDSIVISTAIRHDVQWAKIYAGAQYFKYARDFTVGEVQAVKWLQDKKGKDGFGLFAGMDIPFFGAGTFKAALGYMHAKQSHHSTVDDLNRYTASLGYWYALSKRTTLYSGIGYMYDDLDTYSHGSYVAGSLGIVHNF